MSQAREAPEVREGAAAPAPPRRRRAGRAVELPPQPQLPERLPTERPEPPAPLEMTRNLGWWLTVISAVGALFASWVQFPRDAQGMLAGYWVSGCGTVAILGAMWLRSSLPMALGVAITAVSGGVLLLLGALRDYPTSISVYMVAGGAGIVLGALMQADRQARSGS